MHEVTKVLIHELPFLVVLAKLLTIVFQEVCFVLVLVEKIIPFVYDRFKATASDGFRLFRHGGIEISFTLVLGIGIDIDVQPLVTDGLHRLHVTIAWIIVQIEREHPMFQRTCSQCYCFTF